MHVYWTTACAECPLKEKSTTGKERRIKRWEHEGVLETTQRRLDLDPEKMRCAGVRPNIPSARSKPGWVQPTFLLGRKSW